MLSMINSYSGTKVPNETVHCVCFPINRWTGPHVRSGIGHWAQLASCHSPQILFLSLVWQPRSSFNPFLMMDRYIQGASCFSHSSFRHLYKWIEIPFNFTSRPPPPIFFSQIYIVSPNSKFGLSVGKSLKLAQAHRQVETISSMAFEQSNKFIHILFRNAIRIGCSYFVPSTRKKALLVTATVVSSAETTYFHERLIRIPAKNSPLRFKTRKLKQKVKKQI